jgi:hypothetical protein
MLAQARLESRMRVLQLIEEYKMHVIDSNAVPTCLSLTSHLHALDSACDGIGVPAGTERGLCSETPLAAEILMNNTTMQLIK